VKSSLKSLVLISGKYSGKVGDIEGSRGEMGKMERRGVKYKNPNKIRVNGARDGTRTHTRE
jgi:hypothetical protein